MKIKTERIIQIVVLEKESLYEMFRSSNDESTEQQYKSQCYVSSKWMNLEEYLFHQIGTMNIKIFITYVWASEKKDKHAPGKPCPFQIFIQQMHLSSNQTLQAGIHDKERIFNLQNINVMGIGGGRQ
jgi:hypothetical protein